MISAWVAHLASIPLLLVRTHRNSTIFLILPIFFCVEGAGKLVVQLWTETGEAALSTLVNVVGIELCADRSSHPNPRTHYRL